MPIRTIKTNPNYKEEEKMNTQENKVVSAPVEQSAAPQNNDTAANPLDELGVAIEEFKLKIKAMLDESAVLIIAACYRLFHFFVCLFDGWYNFVDNVLWSDFCCQKLIITQKIVCNPAQFAKCKKIAVWGEF